MIPSTRLKRQRAMSQQPLERRELAEEALTRFRRAVVDASKLAGRALPFMQAKQTQADLAWWALGAENRWRESLVDLELNPVAAIDEALNEMWDLLEPRLGIGALDGWGVQH